MPDAVKSVGQAVDQEAANELVGLQGHVARCVAVAIILPAEGHAGVVGAHQSAVGDGDAVGVAAKIGQHVRGRAEWWLGIGDPALLAQRADRLGKASGIVK